MHSRIFQIERHEVDKDDFIDSYSIPDWFTDTIADYTDDECDRDSDIEWLMGSIGLYATLDGEKLTFNSDPRLYFKERYDEFTRIASELSKASFDDFASGEIGHEKWRLNQAYEDRYGFYVYQNDGMETLTEWMRQVKAGDVFYIGGTVDYHA